MHINLAMSGDRPQSCEPDAIDVRIGENLRACRLRGAFSTPELAAYAGLPEPELEAIESGRQRASASQIWALSREMGATVHDVMNGLVDISARTSDD